MLACSVSHACVYASAFVVVLVQLYPSLLNYFFFPPRGQAVGARPTGTADLLHRHALFFIACTRMRLFSACLVVVAVFL